MNEPAVPAGLEAAVMAHAHPLVFATVSGAHLYGFPSPDSDWDLRGVHLLPAAAFLRIDPPDDETIAIDRAGPELHLDLVTHDLRKFLALLRKPNGYVLEQVMSPIVVHTTPEHAELRNLATGCVTREHARHYLGFAAGQWRLWNAEAERRAKPLLYVYRVLLTGIRLLRGDGLECDLRALLDERPELADVGALIAHKRTGGEDVVLADADVARHAARYELLCAELATLRERSPLPASHAMDAALEDFLLRIRGASASGDAPARRSGR